MMTSGEVSTGLREPARIFSALTAVLLLLTEHTEDLLTNLGVGNLDVVLGAAVVIHQGQEVIVGDVDLETAS